MSVIVKICGIGSAEAADAAIRAGADMAGLNFHRKSPRFVADELARTLADRMRDRIQLVAVLADAGDDEIAHCVRSIRPAFVQLHGAEPPERVAQVAARFSVPVIKAFAIATGADLAPVRHYVDVASMFLFDAKAPAGASYQGGHGAAFDWRLLTGRAFARPWLLAGGLTEENVVRAIEASGAPGVDVSSGVEVSPGRKSPELIAAFVAKAKNAAYAPEAER